MCEWKGLPFKYLKHSGHNLWVAWRVFGFCQSQEKINICRNRANCAINKTYKISVINLYGVIIRFKKIGKGHVGR